jgi:hypothetical protein
MSVAFFAYRDASTSELCGRMLGLDTESAFAIFALAMSRVN